MIRILPIDFNEIPVKKIFTLDSQDYAFTFLHNAEFDFVTVLIEKEDELIYSGKLVYGNSLLIGHTGIPFSPVPLSDSDLEKEGYSEVKINSETLGKTVQIYFDDGL